MASFVSDEHGGSVVEASRAFGSTMVAVMRGKLPQLQPNELEAMRQLVEGAFLGGASCGYSIGQQAGHIAAELMHGVREAQGDPPVSMEVTDADIERFNHAEERVFGMTPGVALSHSVMITRMALGKCEAYNGWTRELARERAAQMIISRRIIEAIGR